MKNAVLFFFLSSLFYFLLSPLSFLFFALKHRTYKCVYYSPEGLKNKIPRKWFVFSSCYLLLPLKILHLRKNYYSPDCRQDIRVPFAPKKIQNIIRYNCDEKIWRYWNFLAQDCSLSHIVHLGSDPSSLNSIERLILYSVGSGIARFTSCPPQSKSVFTEQFSPLQVDNGI